VATGGKWEHSENGSNKPKPLPRVATSCRSERMVRRGSKVRVRQRASLKALQMRFSCCLILEQADTFRTHLRCARRTETSRDAARHAFTDAIAATCPTKSLLRGHHGCLNRRALDPFPSERGHPGWLHEPAGCPYGQRFIVPTSWNLAGNTACRPCGRPRRRSPRAVGGGPRGRNVGTREARRGGARPGARMLRKCSLSGAAGGRRLAAGRGSVRGVAGRCSTESPTAHK
jgi:hypothetical protein